MSDSERRLRDALARIAEVASSAVNGSEYPGNGFEEEDGSDYTVQEGEIGCTIKTLPKRLLMKAAETAIRINPVNAPVVGPVAAVAANISDPQFLTVVTSKYWGPTPRQLTVSFMESTPANLRARIVSHMNAWTRTACISFVETQGTGQVRISRGPGGFWSFLGTDILLIPRSRQTMNLDGFTMRTPDSEFKRVIRHETGHTLGFPHEHMRRELVDRIDERKAIDFFLENQGWDEETVRQQVLTSLDDRSIMGTRPDETSIMCYQLPGRITKDGRPIKGGVDINETDFAFAGRIYPKPGRDLVPEDWPEEEDEEVSQEPLRASR
jgi:hypothetical protein